MFGFGLKEIDDEAFLELAAGSRPVCGTRIEAILRACPMTETDRALQRVSVSCV